MSKIILIDGNSLMFRSYFATSYGTIMQNSKGLYTNAIFGFCNMINKLISQEYDYILVAFDKGKKTFRHQAYDEYKGGRKPMPDEFRVQIPYIKKYLDLLNITHLELDDYEADDIIASCANLASINEIDDIMVVSGDKDLLQLVKGRIHVSLTIKGTSEFDDYTEDNFYDKMGYFAYQVTDYKGLVGDKSDNLPGIKGVGEKTALALLEKYGSIENIIANVEELKGKVHDNILEDKDTGLKCKFLATLIRDIKFDFSLEDLKRKDIKKDELLKFFEELEFKSFIKKLSSEEEKELVKKEKVKVEVEFKIVNDSTYDFSGFDECFFDVEVYKENQFETDVLGVAIYQTSDTLFSENVFVTKDAMKTNKSFKEYMASSFKKYTFDYKKAYVSLKKMGIDVSNVTFDLLLSSYLINPEYANYDMVKVLDNFDEIDAFELESDEDVFGANSKYARPSLDKISAHAMKKACIISKLKPYFEKKIDELELKYLNEVELRLSEVLGDMEIVGLKVDKNKLEDVGCKFEEKMNDAQTRIFEEVKEEFNINSVKQLKDIFERVYKISLKSTSSDVLESIQNKCILASMVLEYRTYAKLISTYTKGMEAYIDNDCFIHPIYKQALTLTGRLSSMEPNIQNMPIRSDEGQIIRDVFISRFNNKIMSIDYSQIELRVLAHMSEDEEMIRAFSSNEDFHKATAALIFNVSADEVTKSMRRAAKAINFGIVYGMSAHGLSETIDVSYDDARDYINKYFEKYAKVKSYLDDVVKGAIANKYTKTMFNRRRYIKELESPNHNIRNFGERTAKNAPIQGSAADIIKIAMVNVKKKMKEMGVKSLLIAQVHDELVFDIYPGEEEMMVKLAKEEMENACTLKVPLIAESSIGESWLKS